MRAQVLTTAQRPLVAAELPPPRPGPQQVLIAVKACAVCRTDLHVVDGELPDPKLPLVLGHEIIGTVVKTGAEVDRFAPGERVGVPWLGWTCGVCEYCCSGRENLCDRARFTGYQIDGGYAELTVADQRYCFAVDPRYDDVEAAPLMCAGLIGYRTLRMAGDASARRHLRLWRRRPHRRPGDPPPGPPAVRVYPAGRPPGAGFRAPARRRMGRGFDGDTTRAARRRADLCTGRGIGPGGACRDQKGRHRRQRRHPHERHPVLPVSAAVGGARPALGRQSDPTRRRGVSGVGAARWGPHRRQPPIRSTGRTTHSPISDMAGCTAPPCWCRKRERARETPRSNHVLAQR